MRRSPDCVGNRPTGCAGAPAGTGRAAAQRRARTALLLIALVAALPAGAATTAVDLLIHPPELTFDNLRDGRKLLVTGVLETGERVDLTADAEVSTTNAPVERGDDGYFTPTTPATAPSPSTPAASPPTYRSRSRRPQPPTPRPPSPSSATSCPP